MKKQLIYLLLLIFITVSIPIKITHAETANFDDSDVLEDLLSSTVNGEFFDIRDYPYYETDQIYLLNFVEYCYSFKTEKQDNYALYLYIYNPGAIEISTASLSNKVQLATAYGVDGLPVDYGKFNLKFCNESEQSDYLHLFYKFRIVDTENSILQRLNSNERRYDVSGIELMTVGAANATEYSVGGTYKFTGYAKGYGADSNAASTLSSTVNELETVELQVHHTNYRTGLSNLGVDHQNQLDSVYFSVPNSFLNRYGSLQRIKAEWWEYRTTPIIVTKSSVLYNNALPYIGKDVNDFNETIDRSLFYKLSSDEFGTWSSWAWNPVNNVFTSYLSSKLQYMFYVSDIQSEISSETLKSYIYSYDKSFDQGVLPLKDGNISTDLFLTTVDAGRQRGYNIRDFDASVDLHQMLSYNDNDPSFWDKWRDFGFWNTIFGSLPDLDDRYIDIPPIYAVKPSDVVGLTQTVSERLLVNQNDISNFVSYYTAASTLNKTTFLFRFAATDYFSGPLAIYKPGTILPSIWYDEAYMAQQTVFLDFDIIQLTFNREGVYKVIPAVSNPIDIINSITPPLNFDTSDPFAVLKLIFGLLVLFLVVIITFRLISSILGTFRPRKL